MLTTLVTNALSSPQTQVADLLITDEFESIKIEIDSEGKEKAIIVHEDDVDNEELNRVDFFMLSDDLQIELSLMDKSKTTIRQMQRVNRDQKRIISAKQPFIMDFKGLPPDFYLGAVYAVTSSNYIYSQIGVSEEGIKFDKVKPYVNGLGETYLILE